MCFGVDGSSKLAKAPPPPARMTPHWIPDCLPSRIPGYDLAKESQRKRTLVCYCGFGKRTKESTSFAQSYKSHSEVRSFCARSGEMEFIGREEDRLPVVDY